MPSNRSAVRRTAAILAVLVVAGLTAALPAGQAGAVQSTHTVVVNPDPVNWTPHVLDGRVNAIAQIGSTMYLGGLFTQVRAAPGGSPTLTRSNMVAFNATTGAISSFAPTFNGEVQALVPAPDGQSIFVGGSFTSVNGQTHRRVARLNASNGTPVAGFSAPAITGPVRDMRLVGNRLWIAGNFTHVAGVSQPVLATLNATNGARDAYMNLPFSGTHNGGTTTVLKIDVTPNGQRLFAVGNFTHVCGQSRHQVVAIDIGGAAPALADWGTTFFTATCSSSFNTYMRDVDVSPDGSYVVFTTTGAYRGSTVPCDTTSRFEVNATGLNIGYTWLAHTGGDTLYAVAVTGEAVYVGGHFRWFNNPWAGDRAGRGAVAREGIAALDPANGLPISWNPGRTRGVGVFDLLATPAGLWVGSDTDRIGQNATEFHGRIAFFSTQGGVPLPENQPGRLPGRAYLLGTGTSNNVASRDFDGTTAGDAQSVPNGGVNWQGIRGAVMIDGFLYHGLTNGSFVRRSFDGSTFGATELIDTADQLVVDTNWHNDVPNITGMFFDAGRLYYTLSGQNNLYYRYLTPESRVVGAFRFTATGNVTGLNFSSVRSMFVGGGHLYWTDSSGNLRRIGYQGGLPVSGTAELVSGPGVDGVNWSARAVFLFTGQVVENEPAPPTASFTAACEAMTCSFDAADSSDSDGTITSYAWDFGDGSPTASGVTAQRTYTTAGSYTVTLTVTDNDGATGMTTRTVDPAPPPAVPISFVGGATASANATVHRVTIPVGAQEGDGLLVFASSNNASAAVSAPSGAGSWTQLSTVNTSSLVTSVWRAQAGPSPGGTTVQVNTSAFAKVNLTVLVYRGTAANPVASFAAVAETTQTATHVTPTVNVSGSGRWVVSYWDQKDSSSGPLVAPAAVTARSSGSSSGGGRVVSLAADSGGPVAAGSYGGHAATAPVAARHATMWSIVLAPAS